MVGPARQNAPRSFVPPVSPRLLSLLAELGMKGNFVMKQELNSFDARQTLVVGGKTYAYYSLQAAERNGLSNVSRLPFSLKVIIENMLRNEDGRSTSKSISRIRRSGSRAAKGWREKEIAFRPARVLMQDFTGVPAVVDLAAMRDAMKSLGGDPQKINPLVPVDLVIDHSVIVDAFGHGQALGKNVELEYQRNGERYRFLKWGQDAFTNFRVVPPGTGICHQVNLEFLAQTIWTRTPEGGGIALAYPDTLVGTNSHTTMVNGLAVLGWGVGGNRGRGRHARSANLHAVAAGDRLQADRPAQGRCHGDRSRTDRDADVAQARRGRKICRGSMARGSMT